MTRDQAGDRQAFEQFMLQRNATTRLARQSYALGGHYRTTTVQRAWELWQAAVIHAFADPRIAELEAELVAEAKKTASEKLRADQMTEQHRMQAKMHAEAREELAALKATAPIPPNSTELEPATPWYPDDSGEWVEVPEDLMEMPAGLSLGRIIEVLFRVERSNQDWTKYADEACTWRWDHEQYSPIRIVAYKVVKP